MCSCALLCPRVRSSVFFGFRVSLCLIASLRVCLCVLVCTCGSMCPHVCSCVVVRRSVLLFRCVLL